MRSKNLYIPIFLLWATVVSSWGKPPKEPTVSKKQLFEAIENQDPNALKGKKIPRSYLTANKGRCTPLTAAIESKNLAIVQILLENGSDPNAKDRMKRMPLHLAVYTRHQPCVALLLAHQAVINQVDAEGATPLSIAIERDLYDVALLLMEKGADKEQIAQGMTPLQWAIAHSPTIATYLINNGCNINAKGSLDIYPVVYAILKKQPTLIKLLLEKGAVTAPQEATTTVLHAASCFDHVDHALIEKIPPLQGPDLANFACYMLNTKGNSDMTPYFDYVDINVQNENGETPLHYAVKNRAPFNVLRLLQKGANVHLVSNALFSPLHQVIMNDSKENERDIAIAKLLIDQGANKDHFDKHYSTLARTIMYGKPRLCKLLLEHKANPHLVINPLIKPRLFNRLLVGNKYLNAASSLLHIVALYNFPLDCSQQIIDAGVDVNAKDGYGSTALHYAAHYNNVPMLKLLLANGALLLKNKAGHTPINFQVRTGRQGNMIIYDVCGRDAEQFLENWQKAQKKLIRASKLNKNQRSVA